MAASTSSGAGALWAGLVWLWSDMSVGEEVKKSGTRGIWGFAGQYQGLRQGFVVVTARTGASGCKNLFKVFLELRKSLAREGWGETGPMNSEL